MKLTRKQFKLLIESYLLEKDSIIDEFEEDMATDDNPPADTDSSEKEDSTPTVPDISFKVKTEQGESTINLKKQNKKGIHVIFVNDEMTKNINTEMDLQIISAHGYIHPDTDDETKEVLTKILSRDKDFKGKSKNAILAKIDDKMSASLGLQGLGISQLIKVLEKG